MAFADEVTNHYEVLNLEPGASEDEIKRAHKLLARQVHPDKNPDDPKAAEKFHQVSKAREALLDPTTRQEIDRKLKAQKEQKEKYKKMNEKRRRMREALEKREREGSSIIGSSERASSTGPQSNDSSSQKQRQSREKNRMQREKVEQKMKERFNTGSTTGNATGSFERQSEGSIHVKWSDAAAGILGLDNVDSQEQRIRELFEKYGKVHNVLSKNQVAVIEFEKGGSAAAAALNPPPGLEVSHASQYKNKSNQNRKCDESNGKQSVESTPAENPFYQPNIGSKTSRKSGTTKDGATISKNEFLAKEKRILAAMEEMQRQKHERTSVS